MNNNDFDELVKRAQTMINNNQVPPEIAAMMKNMNQNNINNSNQNNINNNSNQNNMNNNSQNNLNNNIQNNMNTSNQNNINNNGKNNLNNSNQNNLNNLNNLIGSDNISNLLEALRPYMRDSKKEKIDEYIKLVKMGKAANLFNMLNNNKGN